MIITPQEREDERRLFDTEHQRTPELFIRKPIIDTDEALHWIGIRETHGHRPLGYLKLLPQDFIVEEIRKDGSVCSIDIDAIKPTQAGEGSTYYVDLIKSNISTLEAKTQLARTLGIEEKNIGYAGIKDRLAITAQTLSIRGLKNSDGLIGFETDHFFLKNLQRGKGVLVNGDARGNRFTITIRMPEKINAEFAKEVAEKVDEMKTDGFWNFFYFQRFGACGTPRLFSHLLGRHLLKREYEAAVKLLCTRTSENEIAYINAIREAIGRIWGDWNAIRQLIDCFPLYFSYERTLIHHLAQRPTDFLGALRLMPDQIRLWVYAYACYLFNRKLSELIEKGAVPLTLPFITSYNPNDWKPYQEFLDEDKIVLPSRAYQDFSFLYIQSRTCPTLQKIDIHNTILKDKFAIFSFSLPKGSYATTFLMNFFTLVNGMPIPDGIPTEFIDSRELLGLGSMSPIMERFKSVLNERQNDTLGGAGVTQEE